MHEEAREFDTLNDLMTAIGTLEKALEATAELHDDIVLRVIADTLQRLRENYWPLYRQACDAYPLAPDVITNERTAGGDA